MRLLQGNFDEETVFSDDPLGVAVQWQAMGAKRLHVVDLDGAVTGDIRNLDIIHQIASAVLVPVQLGGGIRSLETIEGLLKTGIDRVVLGTAAVDKPNLVKDVCHRYADSIIVSIDARNGYVSVCGWRRDTELEVLKLAKWMVEIGVKRFIYTDINRDGTLTEPNFSAISELIETVRKPIIASGGISTLNHLKMLQKLGCEGAIVGRALYTGDINLRKAIAELAKAE